MVCCTTYARVEEILLDCKFLNLGPAVWSSPDAHDADETSSRSIKHNQEAILHPTHDMNSLL